MTPPLDIPTLPRSIPWQQIEEFERMDDRRACLDVLFVNMIGVNDGTVDWLPNREPPTAEEAVAWAWFCSPWRDQELRPLATERLSDLMTHYREARLNEWWARRYRPALPEGDCDALHPRTLRRHV